MIEGCRSLLLKNGLCVNICEAKGLEWHKIVKQNLVDSFFIVNFAADLENTLWTTMSISISTYLRRWVAVLCIIIFSAPSGAEEMSDVYSRWTQLSPDTLYKMGREFYNNNQDDSALMCLSICGNMFEKVQTNEQRAICLHSMTLSSRLYFRLYNYGKACEILSQAMRLCDENNMGAEKTAIFMEQGALWMTYAEQKPKAENYSLGCEAYRKAFWSAKEHQQWNSMLTAYMNLVNFNYGKGDISKIKEENVAFSQTVFPENSRDREYIQALNRAMVFAEKGDGKAVRGVFLSQLQYIKSSYRANILHYEVYSNLKKSYLQDNMLDSAIYYEKKMLQLAVSTGMHDGKAVAARDLASLYREAGIVDSADVYENLALKWKDSLLVNYNLDEVQSLMFVQQLMKEEQKMKQKERISAILGYIIIALLVGGAIVGVLLWRKYHGVFTIPSISNTGVRYQNSKLSDEGKSMLKDRIAQVLQSDNIFNQDFSLDRLADLCDSKPRYVSQVINELYGQNFITLINAHRVEEACRRMEDKTAYGNLTLEGIANSVGFKSRVTFYQAFKKVKGMSPTEYMHSIR